MELLLRPLGLNLESMRAEHIWHEALRGALVYEALRGAPVYEALRGALAYEA